MDRLCGGVETFPPFVPRVHRVAAIAGYRSQSFALLKGLCKLPVLFVGHFKTVSLRVAPAFHALGRVAVKQGIGAVIQSDYLQGRPVLYLNAQKALSDFWQPLYAAEPA